jgi:hypothetical protein
VSSWSECAGASNGDSTSHLRIADTTVLAVLTAEKLDTATLGVAVGGRWTVTLLLLVDTAKAELDES